ncbi:autotransporter domain-containing protein [Polynucleobacter sp. MWH-Svant-W18]|uniref:autotransporter domain-containing protein n=1 Tax=Polynucleobacter sp. MWH-Svant-W18 TaxID=1855909 RepID=UPI001BFCD86B|nr:autotransporter outer membrane beta-barrel domain-containing protein [Polynucleobacter sp. MWH-Svant-W18]QWD77971.1 autotransporter domain-containing protein [Polynucleobacter sp. MWH-Svant-W18]
MKIKLLSLIQAALIAFGVGYANISLAVSCTDNTSPTANCTNLVINSNAGVLVNDFAISSTGIYSVRVTTGGTFSSFINNGTINSGSTASVAIGTPVGNFVNNGTIGSFTGSGGVTVGPSGSITTLTNAGSITPTGGNAIQNQAGGYIGSIINSGVIGSGSTYGIANAGTINTITNTGRISGGVEGIQNGGTIGVINNSNGSLFYNGKLPGTYNVIINSPTDYGQIRLQSGSGTMDFGIASQSTIPLNTTTYGSVLNGFSALNINTATTTGAFVGGLVTTSWVLNNSSGTTWDLQTTKTVAASPVVAGSSAGTNLAYVFAGQAANATVQSNGVTIGSAVSGLTQAQVNQLQNVHAEGYSSNMTIGLEQMAHITNTVMDRIHAPMSASPSTKVYQDDEGRYIWADAAAVKGTVNNYNNLAGFGYNLYDVIFGGDIKRSKDGGFGVFAGTGSTSMTESQQVTQNFNTTNFYAGLYGALNFAEQVKLSGALGYMYGSTNANRSAPNVGDLVGGNATSSFKSNGVYAAAKLAKAYQAQNFTVSPFLGASYSQLWMGGASEQGGNTFNYGINSATAYTAVTFAGADFIYPLLKGTNDPLSLIGFYKFGYDWYANSASAHTVTATTSFNGNTQSFAQVGANMGPVSNMVGLGIQGGITKEISARIGVVASYNTYGHEYGGGAELRFKF